MAKLTMGEFRAWLEESVKDYIKSDYDYGLGKEDAFNGVLSKLAEVDEGIEVGEIKVSKDTGLPYKCVCPFKRELRGKRGKLIFVEDK